MSTSPRITVSQTKKVLSLNLEGEWRFLHLKEVMKKLDSLKVSSFEKVIINLSEVVFLDTGAAYFLKEFLSKLEALHISFTLKDGDAPVRAMIQTVSAFKPTAKFPSRKISKFSILPFFENVGKTTIEVLKTGHESLSFLGEVVVSMTKILFSPRRLRIISLIDLIYKVGASALPIVGLISFLIGIVMVYQGVDQLRRFGAEIFTINLLGVSVLRELGILLTAIVVAGRSGSAYTAQLGFMKLNQEIDALYVLGFNPVEVLVVPRILALLISLPLLTFFSDMMALVGGGIATYFLLGVGPSDFSKHFLLSIKEWTFWAGILKAPVFAFFIGLVACFEGLRVSGGAESVGKRTTQSVVEGIFLVIIFDAGFSILFSLLGI